MMTPRTPPISQIIRLIEARLGISASTLERIGIEDLLRTQSDGNFDAYLLALRQRGDSDPLWQRLIHALTIGETYFMRDKRHFTILREHILPRILLERRQSNQRRLTIWCVGCATGEEAYSIAATLNETVPDLPSWDVTLLATDVNQRALDAARRGIYRDWSFRQAPAGFQARYFTRVEDGWQISDDLRQRVQFQRVNLIGDFTPPAADLIFCRHVLMYFSPAHLPQAEAMLHRALRPEGWLVLGQAEALRTHRDDWVMHLFPGAPIYQKADPQKGDTEPVSYPTRPVASDTMPHHDRAGRYATAVRAVHADDPQQAEQYLSQLLDDDPDHARAHTLLASIFANRRAFPEAHTHLDAALQQDGLLADAHYVRGLIQLEQGQPDEAMQSLNAAIYCQRDHPLASFMLGELYQQRGDLARARRSWRNAQRSTARHTPETYVSDLSDMTAARLHNLLEQRLTV